MQMREQQGREQRQNCACCRLRRWCWSRGQLELKFKWKQESKFKWKQESRFKWKQESRFKWKQELKFKLGWWLMSKVSENQEISQNGSENREITQKDFLSLPKFNDELHCFKLIEENKTLFEGSCDKQKPTNRANRIHTNRSILLRCSLLAFCNSKARFACHPSVPNAHSSTARLLRSPPICSLHSQCCSALAALTQLCCFAVLLLCSSGSPSFAVLLFCCSTIAKRCILLLV